MASPPSNATCIASDDEIAQIQAKLCDASQTLESRFRAVFTLKNLGGARAIDALIAGMEDPSALLKHEIAFCLGQMQDPYAVDFLCKCLADVDENSMVRHEAGEALGAIGDVTSREVLEQFAKDPLPEVAETCQLALQRLDWLAQEGNAAKGSEVTKFGSVDPAPPMEAKPVEELRSILCDTSLALFDRYRAMFALRDLCSEEAVEALASAFDDSSALLRHELAYVMGQMQHPSAVPALERVLQRCGAEHPMVRHEAAEALGSIATEDTVPILKRFVSDDVREVAESCTIALDVYDYAHNDEFQYADALYALKDERGTATEDASNE